MDNYFIFLNCQYFLTLFCLGFLRVAQLGGWGGGGGQKVPAAYKSKTMNIMK